MKKSARYSKKKFLVTFVLVIALFAIIRHFAHIHVPLYALEEEEQKESLYDETVNEVYIGNFEEEVEFNPLDTVSPQTDIDEDIPEVVEEEVVEDIQEEEIETEDTVKPENTQGADKKPVRRKYHRIRGVHSWDECFPDINDVQLVAARSNGIRPARSRAEIKKLLQSHKLVNITNSPFYTVDNLQHSMPYLVPKAQQLLNTICLNFIDSCQVKGLPVHLPMVTSVLRTAEDIKKLQRGNGNATTHSCHCYGTTVDITYNRFVPIIGEYDPGYPLLRWDLKMKQVLAEVLDDLRREGRCYVKYERKQACFHLTVR